MPFPLDTEPATVLRGAGLRVTGPRVAALVELRDGTGRIVAGTDT